MGNKGRQRRCDCGCRRPALLRVPEVDLAFSMKCKDKYQGCLRWALENRTDKALLAKVERTK